ncbi:MAG: hypothetical protein KAQ71_12030 [Desulfobulbaceae bacterium]|nr:hypothetical protein [Desulfobulbaceae bacterium]
MSALIHLLTKNQTNLERKSLLTKLHDRFAHLSETFWFCLSLLLFVVMGPFSVFAVVLGLWSLAKNDKARESSEPMSC